MSQIQNSNNSASLHKTNIEKIFGGGSETRMGFIGKKKWEIS